MRPIRSLLLTLALTATSPTALAEPVTAVLETSHGNITVALDPDRAPITVANFLGYARDGFYDGLMFHRVIPGFMIQAGGHDVLMVEREPTRPPIRNEADNGLLNERGTLAMARRANPHSASAQFFINLEHNTNLDHRHTESGRGWGYAVFGRVTAGMEVVDRIAELETGHRSGHANVPVEPVVIHKVHVGDQAAP